MEGNASLPDRPEIIGIQITFLQDEILTAQPLYLELENAHVLKPFVVLKLAFMQSQIEDLRFRVEKRQFVIATNKL